MKRTVLSLLVVLLCGCTGVGTQSVFSGSVGVAHTSVAYELDTTISINFGGYGSSMAFDPADSTFYLLTDRGPNVELGGGREGKVFPCPDYTPTIGVFRLDTTLQMLVLLRNIELCGPHGEPLTGLPNTIGDGITGEIACTPLGEVIGVGNSLGIDPEGLALSPSGTFWVSDEYGPFIMEFDPSGRMLRRLSPGAGLPDYFAKRRPNRGMEGLAISSNGTTLYGVMQSPLYLPDAGHKATSRNCRIVVLDLANGGTTTEFLYQLESAENVLSEIEYLNDSTLLVLERDGEFPVDGKGFKRVYTAEIGAATDISGTVVEPLTDAELTAGGIRAVRKSLYVDILEQLPTYPHDKTEGLALIDPHTIAVVNDDDFSVDDNGHGGLRQKLNPAGAVDMARVYFLKR